MKKFINSAETVLAESLDGFAAVHANIVALGPDRKFVMRRVLNPQKVALVSGGGSGHEPLHAGFVGHGMLDAACPGQVFTSPTPDQIVEAAAAVGGAAGVLFIVKNYAGDRMNFEMAAELAECRTATIITDDDVAVERSTHSTGRRGVAGTLVFEKIVGAAAERGADLATCKGSWPLPPPETRATLPGAGVRRRTNLRWGPSTTISACAAAKPSRLSDNTVSTELTNFFTSPSRKPYLTFRRA